MLSGKKEAARLCRAAVHGIFMWEFLKNWLGYPRPDTTYVDAPYKVEPPGNNARVCSCGRSTTGLCVGLHMLTIEQWEATKTKNS